MGKLKSKSAGSSRRRSKRSPVNMSLGYMDDVHRPVTCLYFLLPLMVLYEVGMLYTASSIEAAHADRVIAFQLIHKFFTLFGSGSYFLPGLVVVAILVAWQLAIGENWKINGRTLVGMGLESAMLAIPLLVLSHVANGYAATMSATVSSSPPWLNEVLLSVGAGIYEELLFRLILITMLSIILKDLMGISEGPSVFTIVIVSAVVFSLYHYLGNESFRWHTFVFRTMAGGYLAGVFILRGFGIVVGCHVIYDLSAMTLNWMTPEPVN